MAEEAPGAVASEVPVAPAADAAPAPGSTAEPGTEAPPGGEQPIPEKTLTQSEVNKLLAREKDKVSRRVERAIRAEVERDYLKQQLEARDRPAAKPNEPSGAPKAEDFGNDYEGYLIAKAKHELRQEMAEENAKREKESTAQREHREGLERAETMRAKLAKGSEKYDDFEDRVMGNVPFTRPMVAFFEDSEIAHDLAYHLAGLPDEVARLGRLSPAAQFRELTKLESKLSAPPTPTKTPPPIVPNSGQARVSKDYSEMTTAEHVEAWRKRPKR